MIASFRGKDSADFYAGKRVKRFEGFSRALEKKLDQLDTAEELAELGVLRGNHLEALRSDRQGQYSIRINDHWRLCFSWDVERMQFVDVEVVDYH